MARSSAPTAVGWVTGLFVGPLVLVLIVAGLGLVVLLGLVYAGLCALGGGVLFYLLSRATARGKLSWIDAYRPAFLGYVFALLVDGIRTWIVTGSVMGPGLPADSLTQATTFSGVFTVSLLATFLDWLWPSIPMAAAILVITSPAYRGVAGVARALAMSIVALPGSLLGPLALLLALDQRLRVAGGAQELATVSLGMGLLIVLYAALGALLAGPVLQRALAPSGPLAPGRWNSAYVSGLLALTVWGFVTWAVMFFVPLFDPYWVLLKESVAASALPWAFLTRPSTLLGAALTFAALQLPGMWAASRLVGWHLGSRVERSVPVSRVRRATAAAVVATWPIVAVGAWIMALAS